MRSLRGTYRFPCGAVGGRVAALAVAAAVLAGCAESLHDIAARGDLDAVRALLQKDPGWLNRPDDRGKSPLFHAVTNNRVEVVAFLLEQGAAPRFADATGLTPLHIAVWHGRAEPAKLLVERGADIHARDVFGDTPLHTAAMHGRVDMVKWLLSVGADPAETNDDERTPAALARRHRQTETAELLEALTPDAP